MKHCNGHHHSVFLSLSLFQCWLSLLCRKNMKPTDWICIGREGNNRAANKVWYIIPKYIHKNGIREWYILFMDDMCVVNVWLLWQWPIRDTSIVIRFSISFQSCPSTVIIKSIKSFQYTTAKNVQYFNNEISHNKVKHFPKLSAFNTSRSFWFCQNSHISILWQYHNLSVSG